MSALLNFLLSVLLTCSGMPESEIEALSVDGRLEMLECGCQMSETEINALLDDNGFLDVEYVSPFGEGGQHSGGVGDMNGDD